MYSWYYVIYLYYKYRVRIYISHAYYTCMYAYVVALACGGFPSPAQNITPLDMGYLAVISCVLLPVAFILLATGPRYISAAEVSLYMEVCILYAVCAVSTIYIYTYLVAVHVCIFYICMSVICISIPQYLHV